MRFFRGSKWAQIACTPAGTLPYRRYERGPAKKFADNGWDPPVSLHHPHNCLSEFSSGRKKSALRGAISWLRQKGREVGIPPRPPRARLRPTCIGACRAPSVRVCGGAERRRAGSQVRGRETGPVPRAAEIGNTSCEASGALDPARAVRRLRRWRDRGRSVRGAPRGRAATSEAVDATWSDRGSGVDRQWIDSRCCRW